jgi:thioredoxin-related protein
MQEEADIAKEDGKKGILIMFEMDECPFCARMKRTVLNRSNIQDYFHKHFRVLSVDIEGDLELTDFAGKSTTQKDFSLKQFRVRATPVFQFIDLKGKPIKNGRLTGAVRDSKEFMMLGKYIAEGENKEMPFSRYKRKQKNK